MLEEFKTIKELERHFIDEQVCLQYLENYRWQGKPQCPFCSSVEYYTLKTTKQYCCKECRKNYTVKVRTIFENSKVPLSKWYSAIFLLLKDKRSMSSVQVGEWIGVTQKTAWFMNHRIREMWYSDKTILMTGITQSDEFYSGGKKQKMSKARKAMAQKGSGSAGKIPIVGLAEQHSGRKKFIAVLDRLSAEKLKKILEENISKDAILVTDGSPMYTTIGKEYKRHIALSHIDEEYGRDGYHTNDIEGAFRHIRGVLDGTFKGRISDWHLQKYANELEYKNNARGKKVKGKIVVEKSILNPENLKRVLHYNDLVKISLNPRGLGPIWWTVSA